MMYEYIAGKHSDREMLVFDAEELRYRIPSKYDATRPQDLRTLLLVNHQVSGESLDVLYQQKTFLVILDAEHPVFNQPVDGEQYDTKNDIPYDWDMVRTVHICVGIGFFENHQTHHCSESILTLQAIEWTMLPLMKGLRTLRFFMATISEGIITAPPVHNDWIDGGGTLPHGTLYYRGMMRNLIASILEKVSVSMGMDDQQILSRYCDPELDIYLDRRSLTGSPPIFVPAAFLKKTFEEFRALRGVDIDCYMTLPLR